MDYFVCAIGGQHDGFVALIMLLLHVLFACWNKYTTQDAGPVVSPGFVARRGTHGELQGRVQQLLDE